MHPKILMPVRVKITPDGIRYITYGVPKVTGDKVKDQIIQLCQLGAPMELHRNCFPIPTYRQVTLSQTAPSNDFFPLSSLNSLVPNSMYPVISQPQLADQILTVPEQPPFPPQNPSPQVALSYSQVSSMIRGTMLKISIPN
jgi:hypothetical protein